MQKIKTAAIISKPKIEEARDIVCGLLEWLEQHGVHYRCDEQTAEYAGTKDFYAREAVPEGADLVIVLGR